MKKKMLALLLAAAMVMGLAAPAMAAEDTDSRDGVVVFYTNDVHTYIDNSYTVDEESGQEAPALRYSTVAALKASVPGSLLVDAGDHVQGTAYGSMDKGATIIELMNAAGYDLATLGNHEFDYGMEGAMAAIEAADFPYVSCNFYHEENGVAGDPVLDAYQVFDVDGVKVAFVGVTTPESFTKSTPAYFQDDEGNYIYGIAGGEDGSALYEAVQTAIDAAAKEADYVIGLGHLGVDASSQPWTSKEVIANTTGLDAFIDGHSHSTVAMETVADKAGEDVVLTQTGSYLSNVGKLTIAADGTITTELLGIGDLADLTPDADVQAMEDAWISEIETQLGQVVGSFADEMTNYDGETRLVRSQETNVGDFCADALYYLFDNMGLDVDVAVMNGGGIRNTTTTGEISYLTCKEIHTFGNVACLQTVTGQQILDALEWGAKDAGAAENGGFLQVSGLKYTINTAIPSTVQADEKGVWTGAPTGDYRVTDVQVLNSETGTYEPLDLTATYNLAGYNYTLRDLGDGFAMFEGAVNVLDYVMEDYMVLANYVQSFEDGVVTGYAEPQGRITVVNEAAAETPADWADVDAAAWYAEAVNYVIDNGIMGSTSADAKVFAPNGTVTRATVFQTLYNLEGKPAVTETAPEGAALTTAEDGSVTGWTAFSDVAGTWYADAANWAAGVGLAAVPEDRTFNGDRDITRAEIATIFARYAEYKGLATAAGDLSAYADAADVAEWAADGMSVAVGSGILGGKPGDLLDPNGTAIRTELATILLNFSKLAPAEVAPMTGTILEIEKYGHAVLDITIADFEKAGYALGDTVNVTFDNGYTLNAIPYFNGYYVDNGEPMLRAYPGDTYLAVCINYGKLNETAGVDVGNTATISLAVKGAEKDTQELNSLVYTDDRADYASDEIFANFRPVVVGDIAEGVLYRSASPVNNENGRASYADALIQAAGIKTVLNLADSKEDIDGYLAAEDFNSPYYKSLYEADSVIALSMPVDYASESFGKDLTAGLIQLSEKSGPFLVHCTEGKDRAGFTSALLECLMGASLDEVVADYMTSYENYYGVTQTSDPEKYELIVENNILNMLRAIAGVAEDGDLTGVDLKAAAENYLTGFGMTQEQVTALQTALSTAPAAAEKAA